MEKRRLYSTAVDIEETEFVQYLEMELAGNLLAEFFLHKAELCQTEIWIWSVS